MTDEEKDSLGRHKGGFKKGKDNFMFGKTEDQNPAWKEENSTYRSAHGWASKHMKEPEHCPCCETSLKCPICGKFSRFLHRCNVDHKYRKTLDDWFWACNECHRIHDIEKGLVIPGVNQYTMTKVKHAKRKD